MSFPIGKLQKADSVDVTYEFDGIPTLYDEYEGGEFKNWRQNGVQGSIKFREVFDSNFVLGGDFEIGASTMKIRGEKDPDKYVDLNVDLAIGYAFVNNGTVTLMLSAIAGVHHQKQSYSYSTYIDDSYQGIYLNVDGTSRYTAFEIGGELFVNFRFGDMVGLFASCKFVENIGRITNIETASIGDITTVYHKTTAFVVKPSVGVSFTF